MIAYFPTLYNDELLYSALARYYVHTGYTGCKYAVSDLFESIRTSIDIEFMNPLSTDAIRVITRNTSMERLVMEHTMFPYYRRFLPSQKRWKAFKALIMNGGYEKSLGLQKEMKSRHKRYLRYCPVCARLDRERHGETYWHRVHQLREASVCPVHHCKLEESGVIINGNPYVYLTTAEESIAASVTASETGNAIECKVAEYVCEVFRSDMNVLSDTSVGGILRARVATSYGADIERLYADYTEYYKELPQEHLLNREQIQAVLASHRTDTGAVCLLALFLGVTAAELTRTA